MATRLPRLISVVGLYFVLVFSGNAAEKASPTDQGKTSQTVTDVKGAEPASIAPVPVYKPPQRGAPGGRVGGGTRGVQREVFMLSVLAPDHSGDTISEQPSLYWYISSSTSLPIEITIMDPTATKPILETKIPSPTLAGIHRIRLADYGVRLSPGTAYRWYVTVVPDAERRSKDILAGGAIELIGMPEGLKSKISQASKEQVPLIYAEAGIWYDALSAMSDLIDASPNDSSLKKQRVSLLSQVGISGINE
jgi:uncharacterized protein DUF928